MTLPVHANGLVTVRTGLATTNVRASFECGGSVKVQETANQRWELRVPPAHGEDARCDLGSLFVIYAEGTPFDGGTGHFRFLTRPDAAWHGQQMVLDERLAVQALQVAAGPRHLAVAVWGRGVPLVAPARSASDRSTDESRALQVSVRRIGGRRFLEPITLARRAEGLELAMSPVGETIIVWQDRRERILVALRPVIGPFGGPQVISPPGTRGYRLDIGADGTAVLAFDLGDSGATRIEATIRPPGGTFGSPTDLRSRGEVRAVDVNANGAAVVVWQGLQGRAGRAAILEPGGTFGEPERIPRSKHANAGLSASIDDEGTVVALSNGALFRHVVWATIRGPGGTFSPATNISGPGGAGNFGQLGVDRAGVFHAVFTSFRPHRLAARSRTADVPWNEIALIGRRGDGLNTMSVGRAGHVAALQFTEAGDRFRIRASVFAPELGWGRPEPVTPPLFRRFLPRTDVYMNRSGRAIAAWGGPGDQVDQGVFVADRWP